MRFYVKEQACGFRYPRASWGAFSNFQPLPIPIVAGPRSFGPSGAACQACKFPAHPGVQQRIAEAPTARKAAAIGRTPGLGIGPGWNAQRVDVMRWVLRLKREANAAEIDAVLAETGEPLSSRSRPGIAGGVPNPSRTSTKATTSSVGPGWSLGSSFARTTRPQVPAPGQAASASAASPTAPLSRGPRRRTPDRLSTTASESSTQLAPKHPEDVALGPGRARTLRGVRAVSPHSGAAHDRSRHHFRRTAYAHSSGYEAWPPHIEFEVGVIERL